MNFCIEADKDGYYTLKVLTDMFNNAGMKQWVPLRRFYLQGDAFLYRDCYAPKMDERHIKMMHAVYDPSKLYGQNRQGTWHVTHHIDKPQK